MENKFYLNSSARVFLNSFLINVNPCSVGMCIEKLENFTDIKFARKTAKQYHLNILRVLALLRTMNEQVSSLTIGSLLRVESVRSGLLRNFIHDVENLIVPNPVRHASNSLKRNYIDACFFLLDLVAHVSGPEFFDIYKYKEVDLLRDYRAELETRITLESSSRESEIPPKEELVKLIKQTFRPTTQAFCVLMIYTHVPIRDDIGEVRIIYKEGAVDLWQHTPCTFLGNVILTDEVFSMDTAPTKPFTLYICKSKTVGDDATYRPFFVPLTLEITKALWEYCVHWGNGWTHERDLPVDGTTNHFYHCECSTPLFFSLDQQKARADKAQTHETHPYKLSQYIITWMKHMGIHGGVNFWRKAHQAWVAETKDPRLIAICNEQAGHTQATASISYKGTSKKRKLEEDEEVVEC